MTTDKRYREQLRDKLKRLGIAVVPDDTEVNILAGRRFEEDMEDDIKGKARRWAEVLWANVGWFNEMSDYSKNLVKNAAILGYEAGYAEGYEVARRQKEEE